MVRFKQLDYSDAAAPWRYVSAATVCAGSMPWWTRVRIMRADPDLLLVRSNFEGDQRDERGDERRRANRLGINKTMLAMNLATRFGSGIPSPTVWKAIIPSA